MYSIATQTHAVEMTLPAYNDYCTTTFPYCTWRPYFNMAKSKNELKILKKAIYFYAK